MLACLIIVPRYFFSLDQGGISNYGTEAQTRGIFILGFGAAALGTLAASLKLPKHTIHKSTLKFGMYLLSLSYMLVLISTFSYKLNDSNKQLHLQAALALFIIMLLAAIWFRYYAVKAAV